MSLDEDKPRVGRPAKGQETLSEQRIVQSALALIREEGAEALSFRKLAGRLGVSPMAIAHHVGDRHGLGRMLVAYVFGAPFTVKTPSEPKEALRFLIREYCQRALQHPGLIALVLADVSLMGPELSNLTKQIEAQIAALQPEQDRVAALYLLVDYTHGFILSSVHGSPTLEDFDLGLNWVLDRMSAG